MKDYKQIWDSLSTNFDDAAHFVGYQGDEQEIRANGEKTASFLREVLQIEPGDRVLEIGCGIGRIGRQLAPYCGEWHGSDISGNMIGHTRARTEGIPNVFLHELPESNLDIFAGGYFDTVYSSIVFMHLDKVEMFGYIRDAYRVLAPGGRAYFDTSNLLSPESWEQFLDIVQNYPSGKRPGHVAQFSTPQELEKYMQEAGFESIHVDGNNPQLVVALGRKPGQAGAARPEAAVHTVPTERRPASGSDGDFTAERQWKQLDDNLRAKNRYIAELESTLEVKNKHIAELERLVTEHEAAMSPLPVQVALRVTRRPRPE